MVTQASPAAADVSPLLVKTAKAVDDLSANLERLDAILGDVSRITGSASSATQAVGAATSSIVDRVRGRFGRARGQREDQPGNALGCGECAEQAGGAGQPLDVVDVESADVISADGGYFTYPEQHDGAAAPGASAR